MRVWIIGLPIANPDYAQIGLDCQNFDSQRPSYRAAGVVCLAIFSMLYILLVIGVVPLWRCRYKIYIFHYLYLFRLSLLTSLNKNLSQTVSSVFLGIHELNLLTSSCESYPYQMLSSFSCFYPLLSPFCRTAID